MNALTRSKVGTLRKLNMAAVLGAMGLFSTADAALTWTFSEVGDDVHVKVTGMITTAEMTATGLTAGGGNATPHPRPLTFSAGGPPDAIQTALVSTGFQDDDEHMWLGANTSIFGGILADLEFDESVLGAASYSVQAIEPPTTGLVFYAERDRDLGSSIALIPDKEWDATYVIADETISGLSVSAGTYIKIGGVDMVNVATVVPEPSSMALLGLGGMGLLRRRRKRVSSTK